ncbi:MAG: hypothetical protein CMJ83_08230 [Planctomycetes bacterium]|nr:hypothetical protein [Planctomycetota bacterium]
MPTTPTRETKAVVTQTADRSTPLPTTTATAGSATTAATTRTGAAPNPAAPISGSAPTPAAGSDGTAGESSLGSQSEGRNESQPETSGFGAQPNPTVSKAPNSSPAYDAASKLSPQDDPAAKSATHPHPDRAATQDVSAAQSTSRTEAAAAPIAPSSTVTIEAPTAEAPAASTGIASATGVSRASTMRPAATAAPANDGLDVERILDQVKLRLAPKRPEITVRLDPPELGRLHLKLAMRGGQLSATVTADDARVARLFESDIGRLVRTLDEAGIRVGQIEVRAETGSANDAPRGDVSQQTQTDRDRDGRDGAHRSARPQSDVDVDASLEPKKSVVAHGSEGALDVLI